MPLNEGWSTGVPGGWKFLWKFFRISKKILGKLLWKFLGNTI
jgi:hypothetical protein